MNCTDINTQMDDFLDGRLDTAAGDEFKHHIAGCEACAAQLGEMQALLGSLQNLPVEEPSAGLERRLFGEVRRHYRQSRHGWFGAGFATAMAASLAIWFASTVYLPDIPGPQPRSQQQTIALALHEQQTVRLLFEAQSDIQQVSLSIGLPANMELSGYPGRKQLSWETSLKKGHNVLALPIMAVDQGEGELVAELNYGDKTRTFRVVLKTTADGAMQYRLQEIKSA
jgi:hypothetical protein